MYVSWEWIKERASHGSNHLVGKFVEQLNYHGLECEQVLVNGVLFIAFITAHNRKDLKSWWGLLREIAILLNCGEIINLFSKEQAKHNWSDSPVGNLQFMIKSEEVIEYNIISLYDLTKDKNLPTWMLQSLIVNGIKPTNTIVDIANFVSLETGQPLHVFDLEKLHQISSGNGIIIGEAKGGEFFTDLLGREMKIISSTLFMETNGEVVELAGIIGGHNIAIEPTTKHILVESGRFLASKIRVTSDKLKIRTKASEVFANSYNQENAREVLKRFEEVVSHFYDYQKKQTTYSSPRPLIKRKQVNRELEISIEFLTRKLGIPLSQEKTTTILERLGFSFRISHNLYIVKIPNFRPDIKIKEDLLEEIGKLLDYNSLPASLLPSRNEFIDLWFNKFHSLKRRVAFYLTSNGYQEVLSYSLIEDTKQEEDSNKILLANPSSKLHTVYRASFINSHLQIIKHNQKHGSSDLFFFEIGNIYYSEGRLPVQEEILSIIATGRIIDSQVHQLAQQIDIYWMKGLLENILSIMGIDQFSIAKGEFTNMKDFDYPLLVEGEQVGFIRQLSTTTLAEQKVQCPFCFVLQLSFSKLSPFLAKQEDIQYAPVSYLPVVTKNISFFVRKDIELRVVTELIKREGGEFLLNVSLVDIYTSEEVSPLHSLNFQLLFQGKSANLQNSEIEAIIEQIWKGLTENFSVLRR